MAATARRYWAGLPKIIRSLLREVPRLVDKAVPNIDIGNSRLLSPAAVNFIEIRRVRAGLGVGLGGQTDPDDRTAAAFQCRDRGVDALDVRVLPLFRLKFPRSGGRLARLCRRQVGMLMLDRLPLQVRRRRRACLLRLCRRGALPPGRPGPLAEWLAAGSFHHSDTTIWVLCSQKSPLPPPSTSSPDLNPR